MGVLDFVKRKRVQVPEAKKAPAQPQPPSAPRDLVFKSSTAVLEYVKEYAPVAWRPNIDLIAMIGGEVKLIKGTLCAILLAPKDDGFVQLRTFTPITAVEDRSKDSDNKRIPPVHSRERGRVLVEGKTDVSATGLTHGDLVEIHLTGRESELIDLLPDNYDGWVAFITAKVLPIFSVKDRGWRIERKYELGGAARHPARE
jgi:hypothetical protein